MLGQLVGKRLGRYQILDVRGEGRMGTVFLGFDPTLGRLVAIKVMHPHLAQRPELQACFVQEAQIAGRLNHPGIVHIFDAQEHDGVSYLVMEFIPGDTLRRYLQQLDAQRQSIPLCEALGLARQVCLALEYAHQQGILHHDITPNSILLKMTETIASLPYRPMLTDFGMVCTLASRLRAKGHVNTGSPPYMSPEQVLGKTPDARSDIYAVGVMLHELIIGHLPFDIRTQTDAVFHHTHHRSPVPCAQQSGIPIQLATIIDRAMARNPEERFASAGDMASSIAALMSTCTNKHDAACSPTASPQTKPATDTAQYSFSVSSSVSG